MGGELAGRDEVGDLRLGDRRRMVVDRGAGAAEQVDQRGRQHEIAEPQRREHDLREGADIDHPSVLIQALECGEGPAGVAVFAVRSEEHTSELPSLMRSSYAVFCLKKKKETQHK